jgi:hypothetical protein
MKRMGSAAIGILAMLLVGGYIAYTSIWKSPGLRYEFTDGFRGWVVIQYGDPRGEPLPVREGFYIFRIPPSGCFRTATPQPDGFRKVVYQYVTPDGQRREIIEDKDNPSGQIWSHGIHGGYEPGKDGLGGFAREIFFVGNKSEVPRLPQFSSLDEHLLCKQELFP